MTDAENIIELHDRLGSFRALAKHLGVSCETARRRYYAAGGKARRKWQDKIKAEEHAELARECRRLYEEGRWSVDRISRHAGYSRAMTDKFIRWAGGTIRPVVKRGKRKAHGSQNMRDKRPRCDLCGIILEEIDEPPEATRCAECRAVYGEADAVIIKAQLAEGQGWQFAGRYAAYLESIGIDRGRYADGLLAHTVQGERQEYEPAIETMETML